jgi:hypothetical protein
VIRDAADYGRLPCSNLWGIPAVVRFALPSRVGARTRLTFTATLNPARQPVDEALGGFVGTARVLFRSTPGAPTTSELFTVTLDAAGGDGPPDRLATNLPRRLEAAPPGPFITADPTVWQPLP